MSAPKLIIQQFPESFIALNREIPYHPQLVEFLQKHPANEFELRMAEICAYCSIALDGQYTPGDMERLADILVRRLVAKRTRSPEITVVQSLPPDLIQ